MATTGMHSSTGSSRAAGRYSYDRRRAIDRQIKSIQRGECQQENHERQKIDQQDDAVFGYRSVLSKLSSWTRRAQRPPAPAHRRSGIAALEKRCSTCGSVSFRRRASTANGASAPSPIGHADTVEKQGMTGSAIVEGRSRRDRSRPASGRRLPSLAGSRAPRRGLRRRASAAKTTPAPSQRSQSAATETRLVANPAFQGASVRDGAGSGRASTSRPCNPERGHRTDKANPKRADKMNLFAAVALPDPDCKEYATDARERAKIDANPCQPAQDGHGVAANWRWSSRRESQRQSKTSGDPATGCPSAETTR